MRMKYSVVALAVISLFFVSIIPQVTLPSVTKLGDPKTATAATMVNNYPASGQTIAPSTNLNISGSVRYDTNPYLQYDANAKVTLNSQDIQIVSGIYNGTHSWETAPQLNSTTEAVQKGQFSLGTTWAVCSGTGTYSYIPYFNGHSNVVQMIAGAGTNGPDIYTYLGNPAPAGNVTIDSWGCPVSLPATSAWSLVQAMDQYGFNGPIVAFSSSGQIIAYNGAGTSNLQAWSANTWYYCEVVASNTAHTYTVWINGVIKAAGFNYYNTSATPIASVFQGCAGGGGVSNGYADTIDFSVDPGYFTARATYMVLSYNLPYGLPIGTYVYSFNATSAGTSYVTSSITFYVTASGQPFPTTYIGSPANDSVLYAYSPTVFTSNYTIGGTNWVTFGNLEIMGPETSVTRQFSATLVASTATTINFTRTLAVNVTGNYGWRFNNNSGWITPWSTFTVQNNVQLISGATTPTNWTFIPPGSTATNNIDYQSSLSTSYNITFSSGQFYLWNWLQAAGDSYVYATNPTGNYGTNIYIRTDAAASFEKYGFWAQPAHSGTYLVNNVTGQTTYMIFVPLSNSGTINLYATTTFAESTLTWNNKPASGALIASWDSTLTQTVTIGWNANPFVSAQSNAGLDTTAYYSKEGGNSAYTDYIPKFTANTTEFWAQTNVSETVVMNSPTFAATTLPAGALITLNYNTTDTNPRTLEFWSGASLVGSYSLGTNVGLQTYTYTLPASITFTRWDVMGTFSAASYLKITGLTINHYTYSVIPTSFMLSPYDDEPETLASGTYNYTIAIPVQQNGGTISYQIQQSVTNYVIAANALTIITYTPFQGTGTVINFFAPDNTPLSFSLFTVTLNSTLNNLTTSHGLYTNTFFADIGSNFSLNVFDRFLNSILNYSSYTTTPQFFVNVNNPGVSITIPMFDMEVYNQASNFCLVNVTNTAFPGIVWSKWQAPGQSVDYYLAASPTYVLTINDTETNVVSTYGINLNGPQAFLITSTNTIFNVLSNLAIVNSTVGNIVNYINLNFTSTNSAIGNISNLITINFAGTNSTLQNYLVAINQTASFVNSNLTTLATFEASNWTFVNSNMSTMFAQMLNNWILTNSSVNTLLIDSANTISLINSQGGWIVANISSYTNLLGSNLTNFYNLMSSNITLLGNNLTNFYNWQIGNMSLIGNNLTALYQFTNLTYASLNNTIYNLTSGIQSQMFLVNNSIYTAMIGLGANLTFQGNQIGGNLTFILGNNTFLSQILQTSLFPFLNLSQLPGFQTASDVANNVSWCQFVSQLRNDSTIVYLQYSNLTSQLAVSAIGWSSGCLPNNGTQFKVYDVTTGMYLDPANNWTAVSSVAWADLATYSNITTNGTRILTFSQFKDQVIPPTDVPGIVGGVTSVTIPNTIIIEVITCVVVVATSYYISLRANSPAKRIERAVGKPKGRKAHFEGQSEEIVLNSMPTTRRT